MLHDPSLLISWARLLNRVFEIDISTCTSCKGRVKVVASILKSDVIFFRLFQTAPGRTGVRLMGLTRRVSGSGGANLMSIGSTPPPQ